MIVRITSRFGDISPIREFRPHTGIDLSFPENSPLQAVGDAVVEKVINDGSLGKGVILKLADNKEVIYGHLSDVKVKVGEMVSGGQIVGLSGNTGHSTGPHLHLAVKENGQYIDPSLFAEQMIRWNTETQSIGGFLFEKFISYKFEYFVADFIAALPVLVGVSLGVWGLLNMVNSRLATWGVGFVFIMGALIIL